MSFNTIIGVAMLALLAFIIVRQLFLGKKLRHYQAHEVAAKLRSASPPVLLDVRTVGENRSSHIKGSLNIPLHELGKRWPELENYRGREIVVYCASGNRSLNATNLLQKHGFNAVNMRGGMSAWRALKMEGMT
jgi:rhodanese-related sulfurtransferase